MAEERGGVSAYISRVWPYGGLRTEVVMELLGDDLLVDALVRDPVPVHLGRCHEAVGMWSLGIRAFRVRLRRDGYLVRVRESGERDPVWYLF
jgi:hypothetical protein